MKIKKIQAREILDSRGTPTIEVKVTLDNGISGKASVPSGASTGKYEALELRDNDKKRFQGKGVLKACQNVEKKIARVLKGMDVRKQKQIDQKMIELDGTKNKSKLGANSILAVSLACARTASFALKFPLYKYIRKTYNLPLTTYNLPIPMFNLINGGIHADSGLAIQEFMIVPSGIRKFKEKMRAGSEVFHCLKSILKEKKLSISVGDEGGFAPKLKNCEEALKFLILAIKKAGYKPKKEIFLALDSASSNFYDEKEKKYDFENKKLESEELIKIYKRWVKKYPLISIEDGLAEDDWMGWALLKSKVKSLKSEILMVGDDLFTTNIERLKRGLELGVANAIIIKPNQIGTLTETIECIKLARKNDYKIIVSHRSGETEDDFVSDLAVAVNAEFVKFGSLSRGERLVKYNRLMEIEISPWL